MMTESAIFEHFAEWPHIRFFLEVRPLGARQWQDEFIRGGAVHQCAPRIVNWPTHSSRSSVTGSIDSARCAGIHVAISPSNAIARTTPARTSGSRGVAGPQHLSSITNSWASCNFLAKPGTASQSSAGSSNATCERRWAARFPESIATRLWADCQLHGRELQ